MTEWLDQRMQHHAAYADAFGLFFSRRPGQPSA